MCMHSTMVTPIHLLLFGARKVEYRDSLVVLDDWFVINSIYYLFKIVIQCGEICNRNNFIYRIYLKMDVKVAAAIVALRPAIDDLILRTTENPKLISKLSKNDTRLINILTNLCNYNAGKHNLCPITFNE